MSNQRTLIMGWIGHRRPLMMKFRSLHLEREESEGVGV